MSYTVPSAIPLDVSMGNVIAWAGTLFGSINGFVELAVGLVVAMFFIHLIKRAVSGGR
jgi:hypothetical protein